MDFTKYGGRRFLLTVGCAWVNTALLMGGYISESIYRDIIIATVAAYITGNVVQKIKTSTQDSENA